MFSISTLALAFWKPPQEPQGSVSYPELSGFVRTEIQKSPESALLATAQDFPGYDVLLIQANLAFPPGFLSRMAAAWRQHLDIEVLSPTTIDIDLSNHEISPEEFDAIRFLYGGHFLVPDRNWTSHGSLWRCKAVADVFRSGQRAASQLNCAQLFGVYVATHAGELAKPEKKADFIGDGKPVVLHVLHSWGGGIDYFSQDLRAGDNDRHHLLLKAQNLDSLAPFGKQLALYHSSDAEPLKSWYLEKPIDDTCIQSEEVQKILQEIVSRWGVGAVIVSSLIGHSLDVLRTGLPTAMACHDVYPFWPILHDKSSMDTADYSIEGLHRSLTENGDTVPFKEHPAEYWMEIKDQLIKTIRDRKIQCVAPSEFAKNRICAIDARLSLANWHVIPHGAMKFTQVVSKDTFAKENKLRVLVPGRINGDKGETLLHELLPDLPDDIELVLLGCDLLEKKFQHQAVTCYPNYKREDLSSWIEKIQPDIALLPSLVPETFGYVMSEMLLMGLPVLCANIGAYAERAEREAGVVAVEPNAAAFIEKLRFLRDSRKDLENLIQTGPAVLTSLTDMSLAWAEVCQAQAPNWLFHYPSVFSANELESKLTNLNDLKAELLQQQRFFQEEISGLQKLYVMQNEMHVETINDLTHRLNERDNQLRDVYDSSSWKVTAILRKIKLWWLNKQGSKI